ncbi:hypothetical protein TrCOL_g7446 [Triparma columacea]|uniref:Uncharacterized protein n=1 Tax=Triparma columacea TaxID=722753 RepID=A0A9W7LDY4_9STRA|nr:hypothetical protein TrCOL_g7446 [Triparma columacea]
MGKKSKNKNKNARPRSTQQPLTLADKTYAGYLLTNKLEDIQACFRDLYLNRSTTDRHDFDEFTLCVACEDNFVALDMNITQDVNSVFGHTECRPPFEGEANDNFDSEFSEKRRLNLCVPCFAKQAAALAVGLSIQQGRPADVDTEIRKAHSFVALEPFPTFAKRGQDKKNLMGHLTDEAKEELDKLRQAKRIHFSSQEERDHFFLFLTRLTSSSPK